MGWFWGELGLFNLVYMFSKLPLRPNRFLGILIFIHVCLSQISVLVTLTKITMNMFKTNGFRNRQSLKVMIVCARIKFYSILTLHYLYLTLSLPYTIFSWPLAYLTLYTSEQQLLVLKFLSCSFSNSLRPRYS